MVLWPWWRWHALNFHTFYDILSKIVVQFVVCYKFFSLGCWSNKSFFIDNLSSSMDVVMSVSWGAFLKCFIYIWIAHINFELFACLYTLLWMAYDCQTSMRDFNLDATNCCLLCLQLTRHLIILSNKPHQFALKD